MDTQIPEAKYKFLDRNTIKYIAMITMLINHIAFIFPVPWKMFGYTMLSIGYFTGFVMIYFLVEGYYYTHSRKKYFLRLLFAAFLSQIPFDLALTVDGIIGFVTFNMMFTLCLCFGIIYVLDSQMNVFFKMMAVALGIYISTFCDWPVYAPVFTLLFVWSRNSAPRTKLVMILCLLFFASPTFFSGYGVVPLGKVIFVSLIRVSGIGLAALCLVFFYNGNRGKRNTAFSKWFFYIFYPAHLLVLGLLRIAALK